MFKKIILTLSFFLTIVNLSAQVCTNLDAGDDVQMLCSDTDVQLTATVIAPNYKTTRNYDVGSELLCPPVTYDGSRTFIQTDDEWSDFVIDIPFTFCFFENQYDQMLISGNGIVTFDLTMLDQPSNWNTDPADLLGTNGQQNWQTNAIFGAYHDMNSNIQPREDRISYKTEGVAPNRQFYISFEAFQYDCTTLLSKSQIILYESSNVIDIRIDEKPVCNNWNEGLAVVGIQNRSGTLSQTGREHGVWTPAVGGELWRFIPNGRDLDYTLTWYDASGTILNSDDSGLTTNNNETITVDPQVQTIYTVEMVLEDQCNDTTASVSDTVIVTPGFNPILEDPLNLAECENPTGSGSFDFNIDQTTFVLDGLNPADFNISYHNTLVDAETSATTNPIPNTDLASYNSTSTTGEDIFIRVEDITDDTCFTVRTFTITVLVSGNASFSYPSTTACIIDTTIAPDSITTSGGTFSIDNGGIFLDTGTNTSLVGEIDITASGLGTDALGVFMITYSFSGACVSSTTVTLTVTAQDSTDFSYDNDTDLTETSEDFCVSDATSGLPNTAPATSGGTYTINNGGIFLDTGTNTSLVGEIDFATTAASNTAYTITYTTTGNCTNTSTFDIVLHSDEVANFNYNNNYCINATDPLPTITATTGGEFTIDNGGVIDLNSGLIDLGSSGLGTDMSGDFEITYTTQGTFCSDSDTFNITIEVVDITTFEYLDVDGNPDTIACITEANPTVTLNPNAATNGVYSVVTTAGTGTATINTMTGEIDLTTSAIGTYDITYTTNGINNCPSSTTYTLSIQATDITNFEYLDALGVTEVDVCLSETNPTVTLAVGAATGEFTIVNTDVTSTNTANIDLNTGEIDLTTSQAGTYEITYNTSNLTPPNVCPSSSTFTLNLLDTDITTFEYLDVDGNPDTIACITEANPTVTLNPNAATNGVYSVVTTAGTGTATINTMTGEIDLTTSAIGTYDITYTTNGINNCPSSTTYTLSIQATDITNFEYLDALGVTEVDVCLSETNPTVTLAAGAATGEFTIANTDVTSTNTANIDLNTGEIDLTTSQAGTYEITYNTSNLTPPNVCPSSSTFTLNLLDTDITTFEYLDVDGNPDTIACITEANPTVTLNPNAATNGVYSVVTTAGTGTATINTMTGEIDLTTSAIGTYDITYTTNGINNCPSSTTYTLSIQATDITNFEYLDALGVTEVDVCLSETNPTVTLAVGAATGEFTIVNTDVTSTNTANIDLNTGEIDLTTSQAGTYEITYNTSNLTPPNVCPSSYTFTLNLLDTDDPTFTYDSNVCFDLTGANPSPTSTATPGGTFTIDNGAVFIDSGISMNSLTGEIDLSSTTEGATYTITYVTSGQCPDSSQQVITIDANVDATITMSAELVCVDGINPQALITSTNSINQGGDFTIDNGASIDIVTGIIDLTSTVGGTTYTIFYEVSNGLCNDRQSATLVVNALPSFDPLDPAYICPSNGEDTVITVENPSGNYTYEWFDPNGIIVEVGETLTLNDISEVGIYTVTATVATSDPTLFCTSSQLVSVGLAEQAVITNVHVNDFNRPNNSIIISVEGGSGNFDYSITDSDGNVTTQTNNPVFENVISEVYTITVEDRDGCSVTIFREDVTVLDYPPFFTPNGDTQNDYWNIDNANLIPESLIYIFDRYGKVIAKVDPNSLGWDGMYLGKLAPTTDYWFTAQYLDPNTFLPKTVKGHFSIVRKGSL